MWCTTDVQSMPSLCHFSPVADLDESFLVVYLSSGSVTCTSYSSLFTPGEYDRVQGRRRSAWHSEPEGGSKPADGHGVNLNDRLGLQTAVTSLRRCSFPSHSATRSLSRRAIVVRRAKVARAKSTIRKEMLAPLSLFRCKELV